MSQHSLRSKKFVQIISVQFERRQVLGTPADVRRTVATSVTPTTCKCCPHLLSLVQLDPLSESSLNVTLFFVVAAPWCDVRYSVSLGTELRTVRRIAAPWNAGPQRRRHQDISDGRQLQTRRHSMHMSAGSNLHRQR